MSRTSRKSTTVRKTAKQSKRGRRPTRKTTPARRPAGSRQACTMHVITDGTGGLPRHILKAVLSQFPRISPTVVFDVFCDNADKLTKVTGKLRPDAVVLFAIADPGLKKQLLDALSQRHIPAYDLVGGLVNFIAQATRQVPVNDVNRIHRQDELYFDRIDAWEFTLQHDDSRRLESVSDADIILLGLSRVSKTPTAAYLGWLGYRVANVSFAPDAGVPAEVKACRKKVIALTIQPRKLAEIRQRRLQNNGFQRAVDADSRRQFRYAGLRDTLREVVEAEVLYKKLRVPVIDISDLTVEEIAAQVLASLRRSKS